VSDSIREDASIEPISAYHGVGEVTVRDTLLPVTVDIIEIEDEPGFIHVEVGDSTVIFDTLSHYREPPTVPKWHGCIEFSPIDGWEIGAGIGYRLFSFSDYHLGPAIIAGDSWIAGEARIYRYITDHISIDFGAGYRIGVKEGFHVGVGLGIDI